LAEFFREEIMKTWFAKWFGGRTEEVDTDEPARFAAPNVSKSAEPATSLPSRPARTPVKAAPAGGFDPYNSGSFERRTAWERVSRR
jgi:hypothetical protein